MTRESRAGEPVGNLFGPRDEGAVPVDEFFADLFARRPAFRRAYARLAEHGLAREGILARGRRARKGLAAVPGAAGLVGILARQLFGDDETSPEEPAEERRR